LDTARAAKKARTQELFNAAHNDDVLHWNTGDGHLHLILPQKQPVYSANSVNKEISQMVKAADNNERGVLEVKSARMQQLFIVAAANVLSGAGQQQTTAAGAEDVHAEQQAEAAGAAKLVTAAEKKAALEKKKNEAKARKQGVATGKTPTRKSKAQKLDAALYMPPIPAAFGKEAAPLNLGSPHPSGLPSGDARPIGAKKMSGGKEEHDARGRTLAYLPRRKLLWNAAANDKVNELENPPKWLAAPVNAAISGWQASADDQSDKQRGIFKSARTQKLFIVAAANVLSGAGQQQTTASGAEDVHAEQQAEVAGAATLVTAAAKKVALEKKKNEAKARKQSAATGKAPARKSTAQKVCCCVMLSVTVCCSILQC